jgi:tetratricopeptide (TPR) repeat protein
VAKSSFVAWSSLHSACATVKDAIDGDQANVPTCDRVSLLDDLVMIGISGISPAPKLDQESSVVYRDLLTLLQAGKLKDLATGSELLYGMTVDSLEAFHLVAWSQLLGDNCQRSLQTIDTAKAQGLASPQIFMIQSLCTEATGKTIAATKLMKAAAKLAPKSPEPFFHLARLLLFEKGDVAKRSLSKCLTDFPVYIPCYELLTQIYDRSGEESKGRTLQATFKNNVLGHLPVVLQHFNDLWNQNRKDFVFAESSKIASILPDDFSINWMRTVAAEKTQAPALAADAATWLIYSRDSAKIILNVLGGYEDLTLVTPAFEAFVKTFPQDLEYFAKLTSIMYATGQCHKALPIINLALLEKTLPVSAGLLDVRGRCQVKVKDFDGAISTFSAMTTMDPENWLMYYKLGTAQEAGGFAEDAVASFQMAITKNPPPRYRSIMQAKIQKK